MMKIEISEEATRKFEAVIGTRDPEKMAAFIERMINYEPIMEAVIADYLSDDDIQAIREGITDSNED